MYKVMLNRTEILLLNEVKSLSVRKEPLITEKSTMYS